jgi:radical SAM superfamily enzyme YgiQ (UPF0313 family)
MKNEMNYLLIMPRIVSTVGEGYNFPLGIAYISATMRKAGFNVFTLNLNHIEGETDEIISNEINENKIDVAMIGGLSFQYHSLKNIIDCVHDKFPKIKIIIGGGIITADPQVAMAALEYADIGVIGEGEETIVELCNALETQEGGNLSKGDLSKIDGIIYADKGNWTQTKKRKEIQDLDSLPFPDYDGFGLSRYLEMPPMSTANIINDRTFFMLTSRSCPYQCTFCFHTVGKKYRQHSMDRVFAELELLQKKYNVKHLMLSDELFSVDKKRVQEFSEKCADLGMSFLAQFRVNDIDNEMISIIKQTKSCTCIAYGLESADNRVLKSMQKKITIEQIDKALKLAYNAGIPTAGNFIFGDIEETIETATNTLDYWETHKEYNITLNFINVYPGTFLYSYAINKGIIKDPVKFLRDGCPQINVSKLSENDLSYIAKRMLDLTGKQGTYPKEFALLSTDLAGRISLKGKCVKCGRENVWKNAKLLCGNNWINCETCGQKHLTPFPDELQNIFLDNISIYLQQYTKIGLWGITKDSLVLLEQFNIFSNEKIVFIDNSEQKQKIKIHNKQVYSPDEILVDDIDTVVFFYPNSFANVAEEVKRKYPRVRRFINVYDMLKVI